MKKYINPKRNYISIEDDWWVVDFHMDNTICNEVNSFIQSLVFNNFWEKDIKEFRRLSRLIYKYLVSLTSGLCRDNKFYATKISRIRIYLVNDGGWVIESLGYKFLKSGSIFPVQKDSQNIIYVDCEFDYTLGKLNDSKIISLPYSIYSFANNKIVFLKILLINKIYKLLKKWINNFSSLTSDIYSSISLIYNIFLYSKHKSLINE